MQLEAVRRGLLFAASAAGLVALMAVAGLLDGQDGGVSVAQSLRERIEPGLSSAIGADERLFSAFPLGLR